MFAPSIVVVNRGSTDSGAQMFAVARAVKDVVDIVLLTASTAPVRFAMTSLHPLL